MAQITTQQIRIWVESGDTEKLFGYSCCYHFARILHRNYGLALKGLKRENGAFDHVWGVWGDKAVDVFGIQPEVNVKKRYTPYIAESLTTAPMTASELDALIASKTEVNEELRDKILWMAADFIDKNVCFSVLKGNGTAEPPAGGDGKPAPQP